MHYWSQGKVNLLSLKLFFKTMAPSHHLPLFYANSNGNPLIDDRDNTRKKPGTTLRVLFIEALNVISTATLIAYGGRPLIIIKRPKALLTDCYMPR